MWFLSNPCFSWTGRFFFSSMPAGRVHETTTWGSGDSLSNLGSTMFNFPPGFKPPAPAASGSARKGERWCGGRACEFHFSGSRVLRRQLKGNCDNEALRRRRRGGGAGVNHLMQVEEIQCLGAQKCGLNTTLEHKVHTEIHFKVKVKFSTLANSKFKAFKPCAFDGWVAFFP